MKNILGTLTVALAVLFSGSALAQFTGEKPAIDGGFVGPTIEVTTVAEAKNLKDDTPVILVGKIEKNIGKEKYLFKDATGDIVVEIDDEDWRGVTASPEDIVEIRGEVDKGFNKIEIDVDYVIKK